MPRVIIVQPALPVYRYALFSRMAERLGPGFAVYASSSEDLGELEVEQSKFAWCHQLGVMLPLLPGLQWQSGALSVPVSKGDVLIVCGAPRCLSTLVLLIKAKCKGVRTFWWGHYWSSTSKPWRAALRLLLMRLADATIFYTDLEISEYRSHQKRQCERYVYALNNGIETVEIRRLRTAYSLTMRPRDILFIGRLTKKAEFGLLLEALVRCEGAAVTLDVIGDGPGASNLQRQAVALDISERIIWHGAMIDEPHIAEVANRCKLFVYPGSVGLSLIHGFAYGLPAIVHDDRWRHGPEIAALQPGQNGLTFRKGDVGDLAHVISLLLNGKADLQRMSPAAIATTEQSFNAADMAARFVKAIENAETI